MSSYSYDYKDITYGNVTLDLSGATGAVGSGGSILSGLDTIDISDINMSTISIGSGGAGGTYSIASSPYIYTTSGSNGGSVLNNGSGQALQVQGDANIKGNLVVNGINLSHTLETIQQRLSILVPDPEKLEKYEALQKAYEQYKLLEALCVEPTNVDKPDQ